MYLGDIGSYRLVRALAEGGFGAVYCGENRRTDYKVAIKLLHKHLSDNEEMQRRFQREVSILQQIRHPHIVNVFDAGMLPGVGLYLVMEWLEGETLAEYVKKRPSACLTPQQALPLFSQLLEGLSHVHQVGITHRDLKPQNLMLLRGQGQQQLLKILDFGIAQTDSAEQLTRTGGAIGTPDFMAPEQVVQQLGPVGPETDLYATGLLLAWTLTGKMAFLGSTVQDTLMKKIQEQPPSLSALGGQRFSPKLEEVLRKSLQTRPSDRYPNAMAMLDALQEAIATTAPSQQPPPAAQAPSSAKPWALARSGGTQVMDAAAVPPTPPSTPAGPTLSPKADHTSKPSLSVSRQIISQASSLALQPPGAGYHPQWYISRPQEEEIALTHLAGPGAPVVLWGPELLGKTWMLKYLVSVLKEQGNRVVDLSFKRMDEDSMSSLENLIQEIALHISDELDAPDEWFTRAWKRPGNPLRKFTWFMGRKVLPASEQPLVLVIDRIDAVQGRSYSDDLFGMLRSWSEDAYLDAWSNLRLLMAVSTTPTLLTERSNQSPFNLTPPVYLGDFGLEQLRHLSERYQLPWSDSELQMILESVGGHPYLVRLIMYHVAANGTPLQDLLNPQHELYQSYLQRYRKRLENQEDLAAAMKSLLDSPQVTLRPELYHRLYKAGLVTTDNNGHHQLRYSLYKQLLA